MFSHAIFTLLFAAASQAASIQPISACRSKLRVETHINSGPSLDVVSSLIIGSEAAVLIDLPLAIPQAENLAAWVKNTTQKPLVAAFSTHSHPDHYLGGAAFLEHFPDTKYYANSHTVEYIKGEAPAKVDFWSTALGQDNIAANTTIPTPYDFAFFTLPNDEHTPIHLLSPITGDTVHETLFWIPSIKTLIAGDSVYSNDLHLWLADLLTPALTTSWLTTLDLISDLKPTTIVPGHSLKNNHFAGNANLDHTRSYLEFWQTQVESKGADYYTPQEVLSLLTTAFPGLNSSTSNTLVNITAEQYGRGGKKQAHFVDLESYTDAKALTGFNL